MKKKVNYLAELLNKLLKDEQDENVSVRVIINALAGRGQAALLILLVLPFCQPIMLPGFSSIFGIISIFIGLRIAFGHRTWVPEKLLEKKIPFSTLKKIAAVAITITDKLRFFTSTRLVYLVNNPILHIFHGLSIALLAFLLALPIPLPFTNLFTAYPILLFGLALLEDDGVMIILAYILFFLCLAAFGSLIFFGNPLRFL